MYVIFRIMKAFKRLFCNHDFWECGHHDRPGFPTLEHTVCRKCGKHEIVFSDGFGDDPRKGALMRFVRRELSFPIPSNYAEQIRKMSQS